jgi:hypothetical protein
LRAGSLGHTVQLVANGVSQPGRRQGCHAAALCAPARPAAPTTPTTHMLTCPTPAAAAACISCNARYVGISSSFISQAFQPTRVVGITATGTETFRYWNPYNFTGKRCAACTHLVAARVSASAATGTQRK